MAKQLNEAPWAPHTPPQGLEEGGSDVVRVPYVVQPQPLPQTPPEAPPAPPIPQHNEVALEPAVTAEKVREVMAGLDKGQVDASLGVKPRPLRFALRSLNTGDWNYIRSSMKLALRGSLRHLQGKPYWHVMNPRVELLLHRAQWLVAYAPADRTQILGYACAEPPLLHFAFTKELFRGNGIAHALIRGLGLDEEPKVLCTHWTKVAAEIAKTHPTLKNVEI